MPILLVQQPGHCDLRAATSTNRSILVKHVRRNRSWRWTGRVCVRHSGRPVGTGDGCGGEGQTRRSLCQHRLYPDQGVVVQRPGGQHHRTRGQESRHQRERGVYRLRRRHEALPPGIGAELQGRGVPHEEEQGHRDQRRGDAATGQEGCRRVGRLHRHQRCRDRYGITGDGHPAGRSRPRRQDHHQLRRRAVSRASSREACRRGCRSRGLRVRRHLQRLRIAGHIDRSPAAYPPVGGHRVVRDRCQELQEAEDDHHGWGHGQEHYRY